MKKLIITEEQYRSLKYILEAEQPDKNTEDLKNFIKQVKKEFINTISKNSVGDFVTFTFGLIGEDGKWLEDTLSILTFKIIGIDGGSIYLEYITSEGKSNNISSQPKGSKYVLHTTGVYGIHFRQQKPSVGFVSINDNNEEGRPIIVSDFISYIITNKNERTNALLAAEKAQNQWLKSNDKFNKSMTYEPSFLGMDNFFFFPKGYLAMDKMLTKFGLSINQLDDIKIRIKEKDGIHGGGEVLKYNAIYKGILKVDEFIIHIHGVDFVFFIGSQKLATGGTFTLETSYKEDEGLLTPIKQNDGKSTVNIVKI